MKVVRFLERENVIRFFGAALVAAPFINIGLHLLVLKNQNKLLWSEVSLSTYLKSGNPISYLLALSSVAIGINMFSGATKAWRYVLLLIGSHLLIQIVNVNNKAWQGPLAWPSFLMNAILFFFIFDQLVWKVKVAEPTIKPTAPNNLVTLNRLTEANIINLNSYRKILFSFGAKHSWGELKTLSSLELAVKCITEAPENIENKIVQINFSKDVVIDIKFSHKISDTVYFKPLNMDKAQVLKLNQWLQKIAV